MTWYSANFFENTTRSHSVFLNIPNRIDNYEVAASQDFESGKNAFTHAIMAAFGDVHGYEIADLVTELLEDPSAQIIHFQRMISTAVPISCITGELAFLLETSRCKSFLGFGIL